MCTDRALPHHTRRLHVHRSEGMSNKYSVRTELYDCFTLQAKTETYKVLPVRRAACGVHRCACVRAQVRMCVCVCVCACAGVGGGGGS